MEYVIRRKVFSTLDDLLIDKAHSLNTEIVGSNSIVRIKNSLIQGGLFGSSKPKSAEALVSTVRNPSRLQSYLRSFDIKLLQKAVSVTKLTTNNGQEITGTEMVEVMKSAKSNEDVPGMFFIIGSASNPICLLGFHNSLMSMLDASLASINYQPDYYIFPSKTEGCSNILMTIDDYSSLAFFFTVWTYYLKVYASYGKKSIVKVEV